MSFEIGSPMPLSRRFPISINFIPVNIQQTRSMKKPTFRTLSVVTLFAIAAMVNYMVPLYAQTANWTGVAADGNWNNTANWDIGVPAEGTNAVLGVGIVANYDAPMVAGSFGGVAPGLSLTTAILNVNASVFVIGASGTGAATVTGSGSRL